MFVLLALFSLPLAAGPAAAQDAPLVPVEVESRSSFSRIIFKWPLDAVLRVSRDGPLATLSFDRAGRLDLDALRRELPPPVTGAFAGGEGPGLSVTLDLQPGYRLRHFRNGNAVIVDVLEAPEETAAATPPAATPPAAAPSGEPPAPPAAPSPTASPDTPTPDTPTPDAPAPAAPPPVAPDMATGAGPDGGEAAGPAPAAEPPATQPQLPPGVLPSLVVAAEPNGNGVSLVFPFETVTGAASFRRADRLWLVFEQPVQLDLGALSALRPDLLQGGGQDLSAPATVLQLDQRGGRTMTPTLARRGLDWVVDLQPGSRRDPATPLEVIVEAGAEQQRVFLPTGEVAPPLRQGLALRDPVVGDTLLVMPLRFAGFGVKGSRQYAQFTLLPSLQGVVVKPWADAVELLGVPNGIAIDVATGLLLATAEQAADPAGAPKEGLLQFVAWRRADEAPFPEMQDRLLYAFSVAPEAQRLDRQRDMIRFMFAHAFAADVLGLVEVFGDMQGGVGDLDPELRAVRGIARLQMHRLQAAGTDLEATALASYPEIALWRSLLAAQQGAWDRAIEQYRAGLQALDSYPPDVRSRFRLAAARAMLEVGAWRDALRETGKMLEEDAPTAAERAWAALVNGRAHAALDDLKSATEAFERAVAAGLTEVRVKALYAQALIDFTNGDINRPELIEQLDRLRYAWRGGSFEYELLRKLGELYLAEGNYREGLITLRQTAVYFPEMSVESAGVAEEMTRAFRLLFLDGEADELEPLTALALYYDFRELTPTGEDGDEMIRKLADRLVGVDLLTQAAELMEHQVNFRLDGVERARVGARLAVINLLNRQPERALKAIADSAADEVPPQLAIERRQLRARALADLGRYAEGLEAVAGLDDQRSLRLRAEINWRAKNWQATATTLEPVIDQFARTEGPLSPEQRREILQLAISLSLDGEEQKITALRERFLARLEGTPEARPFELVTDSLQRDGGNIRELTAAIAEVDQLEAFMADYRERLNQGGLEAIN